MEAERVSLISIGGGAAVELFDRELERVLRNVLDPNCPADAKRKITLTFTFAPDDRRECSRVAISSETKLAPPLGHGTLVYLGELDGEVAATEFNPRQATLFPAAADESEPARPRAINGGKEDRGA